MSASPRLQRTAIYIGGFLGPFAGQALGVILPEFGGSFGLSVPTASLTLTAYLLPFAVVMLFSTHLVRNLSPSRVILTAYAVTAACTVVLIFSPWWWLFLVAYGIMGIANAFTTPVLQIVLRRVTPPAQLGGALGTYTAMQSLGILATPLVAGLVAEISWRIIFGITFALVCGVLVIKVPHIAPTPPNKRAPAAIDWGATLANMLACYAVGASIIGSAFLIALQADNSFSTNATQRGLIVMCGGLAAALFARVLGQLSDRVGANRMLIASLTIAALSILLIPYAQSPWLLAALWGLTVLTGQTAQTCINVTTLQASGGERTLSTVQAFRYFGSASTPLLILPLFSHNALLGFALAASLLLVAVLALSLRSLRSPGI